MSLTSVDPPEVIRFVKRNYPEVELIKPRDSIYNIAIKRKILPTMRVRWCCAEYKENAGAGKVTLIGIRHAESTRRAKRNEVEISSRKFSGTIDELDEYRHEQQVKLAKKKSQKDGINIMNADQEQTLGCIHGKESLLISPIICWTEQDVWEFLNDVVQVPHCELYDEGWHRLGCIGCPMSQPKQKRLEEKRWPHVKRNWIAAIKAIRQGGYSKKNIYGGTSERTQECGGRLSEVQIRDTSSTASGCNNQSSSYQFNANNQGFYINDKAMQDNRAFRINRGIWAGFSESSSSNRLIDEQENEIAENIYDWWVSGLGYKEWYAKKFLQMKLDFGDDE